MERVLDTPTVTALGKRATSTSGLLRADWMLMVGLAVAVVLSRVPFRSQILYHWDSVNFALALKQFNLAMEQPHPPGYVLYVGLGRLVDSLYDDPQASLVWISVIAGGLAVAAMYGLGRQMVGRLGGIIAALGLATSPLVWFYGEIALPHTLDLFLVVIVAWLLWRIHEGDKRLLLPATAILAVAGGVRPQTLVFLLPLYLYSSWRVGISGLVLAAVVGIVICMAWFVPLVQSTGGLAEYWHILREFTRRFQSSTSIFLGAGLNGLVANTTKLGLYSLYGWGASLLLLAYGMIVILRKRNWVALEGLGWFLLFWMLPAVLFYIFVHMGQQGLVFVFLPALLLIGTKYALSGTAGAPQIALALALVAATANVLTFLLMPEYPLGPSGRRVLTSNTIRNSVKYFQARLDGVRTHFPASSTAILAGQWHHAEYYLPDYQVLRFGIGSRGGIEPTADGTYAESIVISAADLELEADESHEATIVLFDYALEPFDRTQAAGRSLRLWNDELLSYWQVGPDDCLRFGPFDFEVAPCQLLTD